MLVEDRGKSSAAGFAGSPLSHTVTSPALVTNFLLVRSYSTPSHGICFCFNFYREVPVFRSSGKVPAGIDPLNLFLLSTFSIFLQLCANLRVLFDSLQ